MVLEHPITNEQCAVQVKSSASQTVLVDFIARADEWTAFDRIYFVCHSPVGELQPPGDRADIHVWVDHSLAATVLRLGLSDWVFEKIA